MNENLSVISILLSGLINNYSNETNGLKSAYFLTGSSFLKELYILILSHSISSQNIEINLFVDLISFCSLCFLGIFWSILYISSSLYKLFNNLVNRITILFHYLVSSTPSYLSTIIFTNVSKELSASEVSSVSCSIDSIIF